MEAMGLPRALSLPGLFGAAVFLLGCQGPLTASYQQNTTTKAISASASLDATILSPSDVFEVRVYNEDKLTGVFRVSPEGTIDFPLVGIVQVAGLTPRALEQVIQTRLADGYIRRPHVTVYVREYNSKKIFVLGEVEKPGTFAFQERMNIVQAITMAGGFKDSALRDETVVTRIIQGAERRFAVPVSAISDGLARNFPLFPGDIVFVPQSVL